MADRAAQRIKEAERRAKIKAGLYPDYFCRVCHKVPTRRKFGRCVRCSQIEQRKLLDEARAAREPKKKSYIKTALEDAQHLQQKIRAKIPEGTPLVADWKAPSKCRRCEKPILMAGYCFTCATGRKRIHLRPEERVA